VTVELALREVRSGYGGVEVLHGVDLEVPPTGVTALLGRNGAGKTTLLSTVAGLVSVRSGRVTWGGADISGWSVRDRAAAGLLLVPEGRGVFPDLTVRDNLEVFASGPAEQSRLEQALAAFPILRDRLDQRAGSMSGGEQQMLAMSRVLVQEPRLLLLDEVSFGLAPQVADQLFDVVADLARRCTVVLVEQYVDDALRLADLVYVLERGAVVFAGEPGEIAGQPLPSADRV
jgi:branched-chain amino acid transport system ATP-binding protein